MKKITILTSCLDLPNDIQGDIGILIEYSDDSPLKIKYKNAISKLQLLGTIEIACELACKTSTKLIQNEPLLRGIPQLTIFHEVISFELQKIYQLIHLYKYLTEEN